MPRHFTVALLILFACLSLASEASAFDPGTASNYLERRTAGWLRSPPQAGQRFDCAVSCHTTAWYAPAMKALGQPGPSLGNLRERLAARVDAEGPWSDHEGFFGAHGSTTARASLGSEAVLNAVTLALADDGAASPLTLRALDRMWEAQRDDGAWAWLDFDQQPWEAGNVDWGAALAALAAGHAPRSHRDRHRGSADRLRAYLRRRLADSRDPMSAHDELFVLWASRSFPGLLDDDRARRIAERVDGLREGATWSLRSLVGEPSDHQPDAYATGLATLVLCRRDPARWRPALAWLRRVQRSDGAWPSAAISAHHSSLADLHLRDAATAMAVMALARCNPA